MRYGLSAAQKEDARGYAIYVARAKSGEPVRKADITLLDNKDKVLAELKDFALQEAGLVTELWKGPAEEFLSAADGPLANIDLDQTVAVIDPPRMGCLPKAISPLRDRPPKYLIYVSCNPATLARDLKLLCADGLYTPEKCALFDMFPRTAHFESVCLLSHQ